MWAIVGAAVLAYPTNYGKCFPESSDERIMGATGQYDPNIVNDNKIQCGSALVQGVTVGEQINACPTYAINNNAGGTELPATYNVVCGYGHGATWKYASALNGAVYNMFSENTDDDVVETVKSTSVLVIGGGAGAWAAAAAIRQAHPLLHMTVVSAGSSTTAGSTGVVWFPDKTQHTTTMLKQAVGGEAIDEQWLQEYIDEGTVTYEYWKDKLGLTAYGIPQEGPASDYTYYNNATKVSRSFTYENCEKASCGSYLLGELETLTGAVDKVDGKLLSVANNTAIVEQGNTNVTYIFHALVMGTGGNGHSIQKFVGATLAVSENTGVHVKVANDHSIALTDQHYWHLEFDDGGQGSWSQRWFAFDGCSANVVDYAECGDYSTRSQSLLKLVDGNATTMKTIGSCPSTSTYAYWNQLFSSVMGTTFPCEGSCSNCKVRSGIIDGKISFKNMTSSFKAPKHPFFLSGTSAAAGSHDAYFGPGATIGFALHTGRMIATDPLFITKTQTFETGAAPTLYVVGVWLILAGIVAHAAAKYVPDEYSTFIRSLHYVFQPAGTTVITVGVGVSSGNMKSANSTHYYVGYATLIFLWVLVLFGIYLRQRDTRSTELGNAHAVGGIVASGLIAYLYISAYERPSALYLYGNDWDPTTSYVWTGVLGVVALIIAYSRSSTISAETMYRKLIVF